MDEQTREDRVLSLAAQKGLLMAAEIQGTELSAAASAGGVEGDRAPYEYGPRLDYLIRSGRLSAQAVRRLLAELVAHQDTEDGGDGSGRADKRQAIAARQDAAAAPASPGPLASGKGEDAIAPHLAAWPRYAIESCLGQGGMAVVYKAQDRKLGRMVALKFMRSAHPNTAARFLREARAQARLHHPAICSIYEAGEYAGTPYIAMEYVPGQPLHHAQSSISLEEKVCMTRDVALALQAAHSLGILHRDIKPHNILVRQQDDGRWCAKVLDFGLARDTTAGEGLTESGAILGTPAYMSPEQARGAVTALDRRTDVYSLGAVLYQQLAGQAPFSGESVSEVLMRVVNEDPAPVQDRVPEVPSDLAAITMKCLRKDVHLRYDSAQALAEDLGRYLAGVPVLAARGSWAYRMRRRVRRHRVLIGVALIAMLWVAGLIGMKVRDQRLSDRRARLSHELGREVELSEQFLRVADLLPLHDVRREQEVVLSRIRRIEAQLPALERDEVALAEHALGRAYLALRRYPEAATHLQAALHRGLTDESVYYQLGLALGSQYQQAVRAIERQGDPEWQSAHKQALGREYLEPAQACFRKTRPASLDSPEYAQARIAFFQRDFASAEQSATAALAKQPWRYELNELLGDIDYSRVLELIPKGSYAEAQTALRRALTNYQTAAQIARSNAALHLSEANAWARQMSLDMLQGSSPQDAAEQAISAAARAATARPGSEESTLYHIENDVYFSLANYDREHGRDPGPALEKALAAARTGIVKYPQEPFFYDATATVLLFQARSLMMNGDKAGALLDGAQAYLQKAMELNPNIARHFNDRGALELLRCRQQLLQHLDCEASLPEAIADFKRARQINPRAFAANELLLNGLAQYGEYRLQQGTSPRPLLREVQSWAAEAQRVGVSNFVTHQSLGVLLLATAEHSLAHGERAETELAAAQAELTEALRLNPGAAPAYVSLARLYRLRARLARAQGQSPADLLAQALSAVERSLRINPADTGAQRELALVREARAAR